MSEMTIGELARKLEELERRSNAFVLKEFHDLDVSVIKNDLREIKLSQQWAMRLMVSQFLAVLTALIVFLVTNYRQVG